MKKVLLTIIITILTLSSVAFAANDRIEVVVVRGGTKVHVSTDQGPIIYEDRVLVPVRAVSNALKCEVNWNQDTQTAQIENVMTKVAVKIGAGYIAKIDIEDENNVEQIAIDVPAMIVNDRTMLPLRAISEALHADVNWDAVNKTVEITMEYDSIDDFFYDRARVYKDNKYGYINKNRELVIPLQYDAAGRFKDGVAEVKQYGEWFVINTNGSAVTEGYAAVKNFGNYAAAEKNGKYGVIDKNGNVIVPFEYDNYIPDMTLGYSNTFEDGYFILARNGKYGVVSKDNSIIVPFEYHMIYGSIPSGIFMTEKSMGWGISDNYSFINTSGKKITNNGFLDAHPFLNGVAPIRVKESGWGFINENGQIIVPTNYDDIYEDIFNDSYYNKNGLLGVKDQGNYIWYDKYGNKQ